MAETYTFEAKVQIRVASRAYPSECKREIHDALIKAIGTLAPTEGSPDRAIDQVLAKYVLVMTIDDITHHF